MSTSDSNTLRTRLSQALHEAVDAIVPRFVETMPVAYFHETDPEVQLEHLKALVAAAASGLPQDLTLRSSDGRRITCIRESSYPGLLAELVARLPQEPPLSAAKVHTATDGKLILDTFELGEPQPCDPADEQQRQAIETTVAVLSTHANIDAEALRQHLEGCTTDYVLRVPPERVSEHFELLQQMYASDLCEVAITPVPGTTLQRLALVTPTREGRDLFARIAAFLGARRIDIHRGHVDLFRAGPRVASILTLHVAVPDDVDLEQLGHDVSRLRYLDEGVLRLWHAVPDLSLPESEVLIGLGRLAHQKLTRVDHLAYTRDRIESALLAAPDTARAIARHLLLRLGKAEQVPPLPTLEARDEPGGAILGEIADLAAATLRGNPHVNQRRALALRLPGEALVREDAPETPYGIFFVHGRNFDGFHVRFRDISRGGIRIVRPRGAEQFALESERLFDEAYNLAYAQQLKNKDIPEGGSKGVILTAPDSPPEPAGRAYADGLLDLIAPDPRTAPFVQLPSESEHLYLGPDENITNELINWIVERARQRQVPLATAFMSSKPDAGINHKEFGVTSEGVTVFLDVALRSLGIDPRNEPFRVTLTGGPDGDVAGNEIRILQRDYGDNARILGIADGSGSAEDPDGLNHTELLRLVNEGRPIAEFDPRQLGPNGLVRPLSADDGVQARNTLHNRIQADALIPAGGRPATIHDGNWEDFLDHDGRPATRLIVEGANLFLTPGARRALSQRGVLIVKDSSANKCGVICSSLEILACMLFDEQTFLTHKQAFVGEVLVQLRQLARQEAEALFREHRSRPDLDLPTLSERLSRAINRVTDALAEQLPALRSSEPDIAVTLLQQHMPSVLLGTDPRTRLGQLPSAYVDRALASMLSARLVYREGLGLVEKMQPDALGDLAVRYLRHEYQVSQLAEQVRGSQLPEAERIADLLREGGTGASLRLQRD